MINNTYIYMVGVIMYMVLCVMITQSVLTIMAALIMIMVSTSS